MIPRKVSAAWIVLAAITLAAACTTSDPSVSRSTARPDDAAGDCAGTACGKDDRARLGVGDYADAGSSAVAAASGLMELNPVYASIGPAAPVAMLGLKYGGKKVLTSMGYPAEDVNRVVESVGMLGACSNLSLVAGVAAPPALVLGAACGLIYNDIMARRQKPDEVRYLDYRDGSWVLEDADRKRTATGMRYLEYRDGEWVRQAQEEASAR